MYPDSLVIRRASLNRLLGLSGGYSAIKNGQTADQIEHSWLAGLETYRGIAARYRRYPLQ
jgi:hypothetical protein